MNQKTNDLLIIAALWLLMFSASSQLMIIAPILPQVGKQLDIDIAIQGTLVTAYALMLGIMALVVGPISDKVGRRRVLLYGTGSMSVALALHNFAVDYYTFLLARAAAGAAGGILTGASVSYVGDYFPYERRGWANGWIATGIAAGQIMGVPLGTVLAEWYGLYGPFTLFSLTMFAAFLLVRFFVPQPQVQRHEGELTIAIALRKYWSMLRQPQIPATAATYGVMYMSFSLYVVYLPTWLTSTFFVNGHQIASLFLVGGIASVITGPNAGHLSDRIGRKVIIISSCIGMAVVMCLTTIVLSSFWMTYILFVLIMIFVAARISPFQALVSEIISDDRRGVMMSLTISLGQIGMGLGGAAAGMIYTQLGYVHNTLLGAASVLLMAFLVWKYIREPELKTKPIAATVTVPSIRKEQAVS
jgi:predicted MFS family arabinose efflux permease